eukprot:gnl/MRDRNA2_/MRDRNA2_93956_c0_seq1.p1 gnl/MRDRNA2_/MRDRNA2_93956_c0~~gnl/MRDRNA2_/MRDRNA2_93956_c0_seq1.p1  ORF type:complete len:301 (+),score=67.34 gnl/MRDRNA2_/MRDRNA2_93956_c0_seq1:119-1021(+)
MCPSQSKSPSVSLEFAPFQGRSRQHSSDVDFLLGLNSQCSAPSALVPFLCSLPADLLTNMMVFVDMADSKNAMALTCRKLCSCVWEQKEFWLSLGGPCFLQDSSSELQMINSVAATRSAFRRWVFGIGYGWSHQFANRVHALSITPGAALQDAYFLVSGLSPGDAPKRDINRFVAAAVHAIGQCTNDEDDSLATSLVIRCRSRSDLLCPKQLRDLEVALDDAAERAIMRHIQAAEDEAEYEDDFEELAEQDALAKDAFEKEQCPADGLLMDPPKHAINNEDAAWLSQRFLMVMSEHHGWD